MKKVFAIGAAIAAALAAIAAAVTAVIRFRESGENTQPGR